ncbi:OprO/OprP family phosphate-selective porin [Chitinophagaceae bacterium LB-8]|uniref:OprO/OprP family phosphate-selective porin n=1 Tax=Paraflavisolibacter caeni TaxID=2982496 RepID=A0A9X2XVK3_9BACT|nr:porin [Paraflavisolibacter caeni]MCU7549391.1 OprO/OprP family phosphate-selective porin [Paraflavisolibacter caeni]
MKPSLFFIAFFVLLSHLSPCRLYSQDTLKQTPDGTTGLFLTIREWDSIRLKSLPINEFEGAHSSFRIGLGYIHDFTTYAQSEVFKEQMDSLKLSLSPTFKLRDFRILGSGVLKTKRPISWKFAYMWDGDKKIWMARETGLTIGVPELAGHIFIGRTKEGYSMIKVMNGHSGVTNERQMALDPIPILADGIKWFGYLPKSRIFWNLGAFSDLTSKGQGFATYEWQFVARVGWMPVYDKADNKLIHIATNLRYGKPLNGKFTVKSRPESNPTPHLINTGEFQTDHSSSIGAEIFYSNNSLTLGSEVMVHNFYSEKFEDHKFYGGDFIASYFFTGAKRPYNTVGSIYGFVPVKKSVFKGGLGEIEGVLHASTFNLNDGSIQGGQFWRITPMVNWYLSKAIRLELIYGYGVLDRFQKKGAVHFFESRFQLTAM